MKEKQKLLVSFSGGRTSAYMTWRILQECKDQFDIQVVFANTGQENEQTLEFVRNCDERLGFRTVWVEAVVHHGVRKGCTHRLVTFETASRQGEPFEAVVSKYGVNNMSHPGCTRELKRNPIDSYVRGLGWRRAKYLIAIGIRMDEARRVTKDTSGRRLLVYPLIDWFPTDKVDVNTWWEQQNFNLELEEHQGNCKWCWKKSFRKHARLIMETPEIYDFPRRMEQLYGMVGPEKEKLKNPAGFPRKWFPRGLSTDQLFEKCRTVAPWGSEGGGRIRMVDEDENGGCTESCEMFPMG